MCVDLAMIYKLKFYIKVYSNTKIVDLSD